jgi:hypothetical protein
VDTGGEGQADDDDTIAVDFYDVVELWIGTVDLISEPYEMVPVWRQVLFGDKFFLVARCFKYFKLKYFSTWLFIHI